MIEGLKPYPKYQALDAKVVPSRWTVSPLKAVSTVQSGITLGKERDGAQELREYPYLAVANVQQDRLKLDKVKRIQLPPYEARRALLAHGDVLATEGGDPDKLGRGCLWRAELPECLHQNHVFAVRPKQERLLPAYLVRFLSSPEANDYFIRRAKQTTNPASTNKTTLGNLPVALPPPDEQAAIVRFIDHADRRIRRYIRAKQKLIKLLEEQKQAIIHQAVTRGLDPSVRLKPSGVEWLEDIPEHWELRRAKQVCSRIIECKNRTPPFVENGEYLVVRTTCIKKGRFEPGGGYTTDQDNYEVWTQRGAPAEGDVFFTREAPAGEACLVPPRDDLCMGQRMMYFRPDPELLDSHFLLLTIYGPVVRRYIDINCSGSTVGHLRLGQVYSLPVPWCPVSEQKRIIEFVAQESLGSGAAEARAHAEIDLLREYRTRVIADVVTGKLDVRQAAANLPDELDTDEPELDEADDMQDADDLPDEEADA